MTGKWIGALLLLALAGAPARAAEAPSAEQKARLTKIEAAMAALHPRQGDIAIAPAKATLRLGKDYSYIEGAEAQRVLTDIWGNPPESVSDVLGLVLPAGKTPVDDTWGAVVTWHDSGYVTDDDARTADYDALLTQLRAGEADRNAQRTREGYPTQQLIGWAQAPTYDPATHAMVWAQELAFGGEPVHTLNYDVRMLAREGVLSLNMVAPMRQLAETKAAAAAFGRTVAFQPGARYADYKPGDKDAGYGLAGLVAAGVGVAAAKKLGVLALILGFGKKFIVLIGALLLGLGGRIRRLFGREPDAQG